MPLASGSFLGGWRKAVTYEQDHQKAIIAS